MFNATSRYAGIEIAKLIGADGEEHVYVRRRFLPPSKASTAMVEHAVVENDRLDNITARYLGDPEQFWRVCDANNALRPEELTAEIGRRLRVPLPE